jgi:hypothetical protein
MTPKEKAEELFDKYWFPHYTWENDAYQVDEKLTYEVRKRFALESTQEVIDTLYEYHYDSASGAYEYWTEVKEQLEKL